jgi:predicted acyltransferase
MSANLIDRPPSPGWAGPTQSGFSGRIESLDQFRGYTVFGMFLVNFLGGLAAVHANFKHNNTFFSYADSIMPSFMYVVGVSYRLTTLRRIEQVGAGAAYVHAIKRSLALILISLAVFGFDGKFEHWSEMTSGGVFDFFARLLKANLWETLAIIGATQILLLPVVAAGWRVRVGALVACLVTHAAITYLFNWDFVNGKPNFVSNFWGVETARAWDGGFFGLLGWAVPMLLGTLTYDALATRGPRGAFPRVLAWGLLLMAVGYGISCLTRLYDSTPDAEGKYSAPEYAESPVWLPLDRLSGRPWSDLLAEPPFVEPPHWSQRSINYWMMGKRMVGPSFTLFAGGFAMTLYGLFIVGVDLMGGRLGVFRILGQNALAAYVLHHLIEHGMLEIVPKDSPLWWVLTALAIFMVTSISFIAYLDRNKIHIKV